MDYVGSKSCVCSIAISKSLLMLLEGLQLKLQCPISANNSHSSLLSCHYRWA